VIQGSPPHSEWEHFTLVTVFYTGIGAALFWSKNGRKKLKVYVLSDLLTALSLKEESKMRVVVEFFLFVALGIFVGIGFVGPTTIPQALTAGFAWTGVVAKRVE
jgi:hypothetical protein